MKPWNEMSADERDALVAEKVFNYKVVETVRHGRNGNRYYEYSLGAPYSFDIYGATVYSNPVPNYSTSIYVAWEIVTHLSEEYEVRLSNPYRIVIETKVNWSCVLTYRATGVCYLAYAASAPEAYLSGSFESRIEGGI